jgi:hypothetical protein
MHMQYDRLDRAQNPVEAWGQVRKFLRFFDQQNKLGLSAGPRNFLVAVIQRVNAKKESDGRVLYSHNGPIDFVDLSRVHCGVGRVHDRGKWSILDRSNEDYTEATFHDVNSALV